MGKKYQIRVSDTVQVPVKGQLKDGEKWVPFEFTLTCNRLPATQARAEVQNGERPAHEMMQLVTTGWDGQDLVVDPDTGKPADFSKDALVALMDIQGVAIVSFNAYAREVAAKEKNS